MDYPTSVIPNNTHFSHLVKLEYDANGNVLKRWGNIFPGNPNTGFDYFFSNGIYDEVTYQNNTVTITKNDTLKYSNVAPEWKKITLQNGKMISTIRMTSFYTPTFDTTYFYYSGNTLVKTIKKGRSVILTKDYHFDASNNLVRVNGLNIDRYTKDTLGFQVETFSDYDNADNPIKHLAMFDELFYRSLSQNNFRKHTIKQFGRDSTSSTSSSRTWILKYDASGKVNFAE